VAASRKAKADRGDATARERLAAIEAELAEARKTIELEDAIAALRANHGDDAVKAALEVA
ncbi:hypothetical protein LCGC14_0243690, partial [marine sediment metagenome]